MALSTAQTTQAEGMGQSITAAVVHAPKKIELNFKALPAARVKQMAAATCGGAIGVSMAPTAAQHIMSAIMRLENGQMEMADLTHAGAIYLDQVQQTMVCLDLEISKLEQAAKPSIFSRMLGKGVATQGTIDALEKMVDTCDQNVFKLRDHAEKMRTEIDKKMDLCDHVIAEAKEMSTQDGMKLQSHAYKLRDSFGDRCRSATDLIKASADIAQHSAEMRDRADRLVTKHKGYLAGAKAGP